MGLLDDAIRQHLELKRRHGADPGDVAKLEHEAFGPVEREDALAVPEASAHADASSHDDDHAAAAAVAHEEEVAYEESEHEAEEAWAATPHPEPAVEPEPASAPEPVAEEPPTTVVPPPPADDAVPGEHDELEETPEFLQETPEHDRLWFEQKPPRDFDF